MNTPPKKERGFGTALKRNNAAAYPTLLPSQLSSRAAEAERLAREFWRTHQVRHLQALARYLDGVFERLSTGSKP